MIITDNELATAAKALEDVACSCQFCFREAVDTPIEDLIKDLIEARGQIKVLEGGKCQC